MFDLACVSKSQSSCIVVEKWLHMHCVVLLHDKLFSTRASITHFVDSKVTNLVLAIYAIYSVTVWCDLILHW